METPHAGALDPDPPEVPLAAGDRPILTLRRLAAAMFRGKLLLIPAAVFGTAIGLVVALLKPNEYLSRGTFLFQQGSENIVVAPVSAGNGRPPMVYGNRGLPGNAPAILLSDEVMRRVVREVGAARVLTPYEPGQNVRSEGLVGAVQGWIHAFQRWLHASGTHSVSREAAVRHVDANLSIAAPPGSNLVHVMYKANDPALAQQVLTAYMQVARVRHLEVYRDDTGTELVETRYEAAHNALETARNELDAFLEGAGGPDLEARYQTARDRLEDSRGRIGDLKGRINTQALLLEKLEKRLEQLPPEVFTEEPVYDQELISQLNREIHGLKSDLVRLQTSLKHPETDQKVEQLRKRLAEREKALQEVRTTPVQVVPRKVRNPEWAATKRKTDELRLQLAVDREVFAGAQQRHETLEKAAAGLAQYQALYRTHTGAVAEAQARLRGLRSQLALARDKKEMSQSRMSALQIVDEPDLPLLKQGPNRLRIALGGLLSAFFGAVALLFFRAVTDRTFRTESDVEQCAGIRVLATIPDLGRKSLRRHRSLRFSTKS